MVIRIMVALPLVSATLAITSVAVSQPALADCASHHIQVLADDAGPDGYGNSGSVYVNTQSALSNLQGAIWRSLQFWNDAQTSFVEFGWTDNNGGHTSPTPASDYMVNGIVQPPHLFSGTLPYNSNHTMVIMNYTGSYIYRYYLDGDLEGYSPTMTFNSGFSVGNSEHYNNCDTLWTDFSSLEDQINIPPNYPTWSSSWSQLACFGNGSINDWYLHGISNSEFQVNQTAAGGWGNNCV